MLLPIAYRINYMLNLTFRPFRNELKYLIRAPRL